MAVKNVGKAAVECIIKARKQGGKFQSLKDFCKRVDSRSVNKKVIESLIKCGAFDSLGAKRAQLMQILDSTLEFASKLHKSFKGGQLSLFEGNFSLKDELPDIEEWPIHQLLNFEKQLLGFFVTGHPLSKYKKLLEKMTPLTISQISKAHENKEIVVGGVLEILKITSTRKNAEMMAILKLEDTESQIEVFAFPRVYQEYLKNIRSGNLVIVKGKVSIKEDTPKIISSKILSLEEALENIPSLEITLPDTQEETLHKLREIFISFPGNTVIFLHFLDPRLKLIKIKVNEHKIKVCEEFISRLSLLVGEENFSLTPP